MVMEVYNLLLCGIITPLQFHLTPILITWGKFYSEDFFFPLLNQKDYLEAEYFLQYRSICGQLQGVGLGCFCKHTQIGPFSTEGDSMSQCTCKKNKCCVIS